MQHVFVFKMCNVSEWLNSKEKKLQESKKRKGSNNSICEFFEQMNDDELLL